jgi:hypothetical protein
VWVVPTEPLRVPEHLGVDHFAAFPSEFPRRIIQGWSPAGVCVECGEGRRPVTSREASLRWPSGVDEIGKSSPRSGDDRNRLTLGAVSSTYTLTGYACACDPAVCRSCGADIARCKNLSCCEAFGGDDDDMGESTCTHGTLPPTRPSVILDPFGGTGTTALVAKALGRHGISVDMSADYCRLADWRTNDRNQLAKVLGVDKQPEPDVEQLDLFTEEPVA